MAADAASKPALLRSLRPRSALAGFIAMRAADELAAQMLNVGIGWYVYAATHDPMSLAFVGLAQFLPNIGLVLIAGHVPDRFDRRTVVALSLSAQMLLIAGFAAFTAVATPAAAPVYVLLLAIGSARAFASPAMAALLPRLMSAAEFPRAVAAASSIFQLCSIAGPAAGGLVYAVIGPGMFAVVALCYLVATIVMRSLASAGAAGAVDAAGDGAPDVAADSQILGGIRYIWSNRLLLGLMSLDLFAVLLGGVTALLPIYAKDILAVGPFGLGCLRCAPGVGAALIGVVLARRAIDRGAGKRMLLCVAGFGASIVVFALSKNAWLSLVALAAAGGFDMVSMVVRQTLVQLSTPDAMRGRVSAVHFAFVGASSELGEFESGVAAALFGTVPAALLGGLGTLGVVALWSRLFPELRQADRSAPAPIAPGSVR